MKINFDFSKRYHLFLHYGWFLQNLGKDFIRTNMHTTVFQSITTNQSVSTDELFCDWFKLLQNVKKKANWLSGRLAYASTHMRKLEVLGLSLFGVPVNFFFHAYCLLPITL